MYRQQDGMYRQQDGMYRQKDGMYRQQDGMYRQKDGMYRQQDGMYRQQDGMYRQQNGMYKVKKRSISHKVSPLLTLTNQNFIQEEIKSRLQSDNACYHSVQNVLCSSLVYQSINTDLVQ
jgi:hypothetical protein